MITYSFRSRISVLLSMFYWGLLLFVLRFPVRDFMANPSFGKIGGIVLIVLILVFSLTLWFGITYRITEDELEIRILNRKMGGIKLSQIHTVERTYFALSAPAVSLKRIGFRFGKGQIGLVSPAQERLFLQILRERCPQARFSIEDKKSFFYRIIGWDFFR